MARVGKPPNKVLNLAKPSETSETIVLRVPREARSLPVMRLVIGGVASRHALSVEGLDDLLLAVETLLRDEPATGPELVLKVCVPGEVFKVTLGGLTNLALLRELGAAACSDPERERRLDVRLVMDSLVDGYRAGDEEADGSFAVEMEKRIS